MESKSQTGAAVVVLIVVVTLLVVMGSNHQTSSPTLQPPSPTHAAHIIRLNQMDPAQYASQREYTMWAASACSTTSMTEVLNYYGAGFTISHVLQVEQSVHAISANEGLLDEDGIHRTVEQFGYHATIDHTHSLAQVIALANNGTPVIVSIPPGRSSKFPNGHILVTTGGNAHSVFLADSSGYNLDTLPRSQFQMLWSGLTAVIIPTAASKVNTPDYRALAEQDAQAEGISPETFSRQVNDESGFQPDIVSPAGAIGIAQIMPDKAKELGIDPHDPIASLKAAAHLMATYLKRYGGDYAKALAAYEAGPGTVDRAIRLGGAQWATTKYLAASTCRYLHTILNEEVCRE